MDAGDRAIQGAIAEVRTPTIDAQYIAIDANIRWGSCVTPTYDGHIKIMFGLSTPPTIKTQYFENRR